MMFAEWRRIWTYGYEMNGLTEIRCIDTGAIVYPADYIGIVELVFLERTEEGKFCVGVFEVPKAEIVAELWPELPAPMPPLML